MREIIVKKRFLHCVLKAIHPTEFLPSEKPISVDEETAEIAIREGWADPLATGRGEPGLQSPGSGEAKPLSVSQAVPVSPKSRLGRSRGKRGRS